MPGANPQRAGGAPLFRTLVTLPSSTLVADGRSYALNAGMQVTAEIMIAERSVLEYLTSPIRGAFHEAARER